MDLPTKSNENPSQNTLTDTKNPEESENLSETEMMATTDEVSVNNNSDDNDGSSASAIPDETNNDTMNEGSDIPESTSGSEMTSNSGSVSDENNQSGYQVENGALVDVKSGRTLASFNGVPIKVKAVYLSGPMAGYNLDHYIDLVNTTKLNSLVIDIKDEGHVNYETAAEPCHTLKLYKKNYKVDEVLKKCHENGIYVIGRIVVFRDNPLAKIEPGYAIKRPDGAIWLENKNKDGAWTSPAVEEVLNYNIAIAKDAVERGFDEIQFDYVRFPTVPKSNPAAYPEDMPDKIDVIDNFLKKANEEIKSVRQVPVSADVFGIIAESIPDGKAIGQQLEMLGKEVDYLSPMIYPSHFANAGTGIMGNGVGQKINGVLFTAPDLKPYDVILQSLLRTKDRVAETTEFRADIRAYLQDFTASYIGNKNYYQTYGPTQLRAQIQAVYDAGYEEWILWNGKNNYSEDGLLPQSE